MTVLAARFDKRGRLVDADSSLIAINARAGGSIGAELALPALATVVSLARRLEVEVARKVTLADDGADIDLWARAQPDGDGVRLTVSGWREVRSWRPDPRLDDIDAAARWDCDAALRLTLVAPAVGVDPASVLGKPLTVLFDLDGEGEGLMPILAALAARTPFKDQPARRRTDGARVLLSATVRSDGAGGFAGLIGDVRRIDTSPTADTQAAVPDGLDRALRAPLARIVANADSINAQADGPIAPDYADYAADIAHAGRHLIALVDDLIDLQAIDRPDFAVEAERIDLADVVRRAAGLLAVRADNAQVVIERPAVEDVVWTVGDFRRSLQVLVNLIGNAIRYSPIGSVVTVEVATDGRGVRASVTDQGQGIATADQVRIFDKFARLDPSEIGGSGLGLYIARRLARTMGGELSVASASGEGSRFTLELPAG